MSEFLCLIAGVFIGRVIFDPIRRSNFFKSLGIGDIARNSDIIDVEAYPVDSKTKKR